MTTIPSNLRRALRREPRVRPPAEPVAERPALVEPPPVEIAPNDPLIAYFSGATGAVDIGSLQLDSPALAGLREAGVRVVVPLVSQGELIGLLNLGPRRSEQEYSTDDRKLLNDLAGHTAPAVRVAQLVREQEAEIRERERIEGELEVARLIQQQFLPHELPELPGWHVAAFYKPARQVGGDFYDFLDLPDGQIGIVVGDVTDKGVPAALVMATTHSILRAEAPRLVSPGEVLGRVNDLLVTEMPAHMFVTCLYAVLDPVSGRLRYANAGHNLPYLRTVDGVSELRARGMPLGLMPGMAYEEKETALAPGDDLLLHSDGLAEAHSPERQMFGFPRLAKLAAEGASGQELIDLLLNELAKFTGPGWEQEDDITLVTLRRTVSGSVAGSTAALTEFEVASEPGNERIAIERVAAAVGGPELPVGVRVAVSGAELSVRVTDQGGDRPVLQAERPDLEAKLAGEQSPRGWGLFLIESMVDELRTSADERQHAVELIVRLEGVEDHG